MSQSQRPIGISALWYVPYCAVLISTCFTVQLGAFQHLHPLTVAEDIKCILAQLRQVVLFYRLISDATLKRFSLDS